MFTTCPNCARQYRIRAEHLSVASGEVRCGFCGEQFNALGRLSDEPLLSSESDTVGTGAEIEGEEIFDIESFDEEIEPEPQFDIPLSASDFEVTHEPVVEVKLENISSRQTSVAELSDDLPEVLLEDQPVRHNRLATVLWSLGALFLIITVAAQLTWFNRDYILMKYPQLTPHVEQLCEYFNCEFLRQRNISAIKLLNRDVRLHPLYEDTLLVNATIANRSDSVQPFPRIQLTLFNTLGEMVAFREFNPKEYLDESMTVNKGMRPDQPIHFALEVTGSSEDAVSFEFRFL